MTTQTPSKTTEPDKTYWESDNGEICCEDIRCAGMHLTHYIKARPKVKKHTTPLGTYTQLTQADIDYVRWWSDDKDRDICETCEWRKNSKLGDNK